MNDRPTSGPTGAGQDHHLDEHRCLDLLRGWLTPAEEERVLSHLAGCPACEKLFQERAAEAERINATRALRVLPGGELILERRGTAVPAYEQQRPRRRDLAPGWELARRLWAGLRAGGRLRPVRLAGALAAALVLVLVIAWPHRVTTPRAPHLHLLPPYSMQLEMRDAPAAVSSVDLEAGLEIYDRRDFRRAVAALRRAGGSDLKDVHERIRTIYLGSALAWSGEYEEAARVLEKVSFILVPGEWGREAQWTLYIALRESGRQAPADSLLQVLAGKPGEIGERARALLADRGRQ